MENFIFCVVRVSGLSDFKSTQIKQFSWDFVKLKIPLTNNGRRIKKEEYKIYHFM